MAEKTVLFAVCDDDEIVCESICAQIEKILNKFGYEAKTDKYVSPVLLYRNIERGDRKYSALFLDIDMPRLNGIDLAKALKKKEDAPEIIFVSNRDDLVFESFAVRPFGFVRKNNFSRDLADTLRSYVSKYLSKTVYVALRTNNNSVIRKVPASEIVYIESFRDKQAVHMADGEEIECRQSMEEFETKLDSYDIVRVYKGYLVNLKYVQRIERTGILLNYRDGVTVMVSRHKVQDLKTRYLQYLRKTGMTILDGEG